MSEHEEPSYRRSEPARSRPTIPDGYGLSDSTDGLMEWSDVEDRLRSSLHYWISTVRPDATPHTVPRWGVWLDGRFWYDGSPATRHARNLSENPACTLTLENGKQAVIVEGTSAATRADADGLGSRLAEQFMKYHDSGYAPAADSWADDGGGGGLRVITPKRALAWFDFPRDCTRFTF